MLAETKMRTIQFIETYTTDVYYYDESLNKNIAVGKTFMASEEEVIQEIEDFCDGTSTVIFVDGTAATLPNELFVMTDWADENECEWGPQDEGE
jgi:hypothetical protein